MAETSNRPSRVMLVDDEPHITHVLQRRLKRNGYETLVARDGQEALGIVAGFCPDIVLSDLQMPRLDGLSLAQALRALPETAETPILLISGRGFLLDDERVRRTNIAEIIEKPFSIDTVFGHIERLLANRGISTEAA